MNATSKNPQSLSHTGMCRFCGTTSNVIVDLFKNGLAQKAEKCFYLAINPADCLPKLVCKACEYSLCAAYAFGERARLVDKELRRKYGLLEEDYTAVEYLEGEAPFEYSTYEADPVGLALEKLKAASSIVIKKVSVSEPVAPVENHQEGFKEEESTVEKACNRRKEETIIKIVEPVPGICLGCAGRFNNVEELMRHKDECSPAVHACQKCDAVFDDELALKKHKQKHYSYVYDYRCTLCDKTYKNLFSLNNHRARDHGEEIEELGYAYRCCNQEFPTRKTLHEHAAACHSKQDPVTCAVCGKSYKNKTTLIWHQKIHTDYRPWACGECGAAFRKKAQLFLHRQQHTGVKLFRCDECPKQYGRKEALKNHYRRFHSDGGEPMPKWSQTGEKLGLSRKRVAQDHSYEGPVKVEPENDDIGREEEVNDE